MQPTKNTHLQKAKFFRSTGFTLVELIVVITILVILGTIAFMNIGGYSSSARDSSRISDMTNIKKALQLANIKTGAYPTPSNNSGVTFSGGIAWYQGTIGDSVVVMVNAAGFKLSKRPTDPLYTGVEYTYSLLGNLKEYQIAATMEDAATAYNPIITPAYAANSATAYIAGNYNGLLVKVSTGTTTVTTYYLALPSIILQNLSYTELTNPATQSGNLVLHKKGNIPSSYTSNGVVSAAPSITFDALKSSDKLTSGTGIVAYTTTGSLDSAGVTTMMNNAFNLYNVSNIKSDNTSASQIAALVSGGSGSTALIALYNGSVSKNVGGPTVSPPVPLPATCSNTSSITYEQATANQSAIYAGIANYLGCKINDYPGGAASIIGTTVSSKVLVASQSDDGSNVSWKLAVDTTPGTTSSTDGLANTNAIVTAGIANHPAAQLCRNKSALWYLPANNELSTYFANRASVSAFWTSDYWSSTESATNTARTLNMSLWMVSNIIKTNTNLIVRCASRF